MKDNNDSTQNFDVLVKARIPAMRTTNGSVYDYTIVVTLKIL